MKEGACDYITKPFHMDDIQLKVARALHGRRREEALKKSKTVFLSLILAMPVLVSAGVMLGMFWKDL
jgi:DNA-binding NtrC family response regulator